jgi:hypothetical protein
MFSPRNWVTQNDALRYFSDFFELVMLKMGHIDVPFRRVEHGSAPAGRRAGPKKMGT